MDAWAFFFCANAVDVGFAFHFVVAFLVSCGYGDDLYFCAEVCGYLHLRVLWTRDNGYRGSMFVRVCGLGLLVIYSDSTFGSSKELTIYYVFFVSSEVYNHYARLMGRPGTSTVAAHASYKLPTSQVAFGWSSA